MAELEIVAEELVLKLSAKEKLEGIHGDLRAPLSAIRSVEILENAHQPADHGLKLGTRIHGVIEVATVTSKGERIFAAVHHDTPRGIRIDLEGTEYDAWIVGCSDPEKVAEGIRNR